MGTSLPPFAFEAGRGGAILIDIDHVPFFSITTQGAGHENEPEKWYMIIHGHWLLLVNFDQSDPLIHHPRGDPDTDKPALCQPFAKRFLYAWQTTLSINTLAGEVLRLDLHRTVGGLESRVLHSPHGD